ncbi:hypothetical protein BHE90_017535 [Fusarium euwallaceae]|uniref:Uncharacterized protein n=2 Tax=Fusarium solani species complex TaxID=232080 RepID=A0A428RJD0_9HYPO|nr:hypothetical protein CEP52_017701 [Fusarium oligoseptatum]RTE68088.1 hypothetical protein BHE90_017535 [Fusarium euwallaceae]
MPPQRNKPKDAADNVPRRAELAKIARRLQDRLALARFKTDHGCEDLPFDAIELAYEEEIRQRHSTEYDLLLCSAALAAQLPHHAALPSLSHEANPCLQASGYANVRKRALCPSLLKDSPCNLGKRPRTAVKNFNDHSREHIEEQARPLHIDDSPGVPENDDGLSTARFWHGTNLSTIPTTPPSRFDWTDFINVTPCSPVQNIGTTMSPIRPKLPPATIKEA